jgi:hypothetical protein
VVRFCDRDIGLIDRHGRFRRFAPPRFGLCDAAPDPEPGTPSPPAAAAGERP